MQRITRNVIDPNNTDKMSLLDQYNFLLSFLKPHLTERTFSILPTPKLIENNQYVAWYTHLEGQPILLSSITDDARKNQVEETLKTRINDIELAINSIPLTDEQQNLVLFWLPRIKSLGNQIYVINDDPVIVNTFEEPVLPKPAIVPPVTPRKTFWRWWHFLLLALLLVGLLALLWYFWCPYGKEKTPDSLPIVNQPVAEVKPEPVPVIEQPEEPKAVTTSESAPIPEPDPNLQSQQPPDPEPKVINPPNCISKEEMANNSNPPKMALIFDNSLSMIATIAESPAEVEHYFEYLVYGPSSYMSRQEKIAYEKKMTRLPSRLSASKKVALSSIDQIQQDIDISLVTLSTCPGAGVTSFFSYPNRDKLKKKINQLQPIHAEYFSYANRSVLKSKADIPNNSDKGGTPLYSGLEKASKMLDGVTRDDYILIISDGEDTCSEKNICTLAKSIAKQKPRLKINIIDIAGEHKIDCVAKMTGGKVYIAQNPKAMIKQMNNAVADLKINRPLCQ
ncbi:hypothetical protein A9G11_08630 [Gilliamella sp. wkB108]|uniref:hypothetical protein n=1 Tax=Gilliamella sp. wkB108 TaxID=3120256 RepID=UPI00080E4260|nr:hypothetical protein [Gilliamella apicola]OCG20993.1 hypothetical protein A9G11_08630 [Gilliamella apicola]